MCVDRVERVDLGSLPGWLDLPEAEGATSAGVPAALLLHPFGAWDRHGYVPAAVSGSHAVWLFEDLAVALLRAGVAVARYDARVQTFTDLVEDASTALRRLRSDPRIGEVTLLGISLGTEVAIATAAGAGPVRMVLVAPVAESYPVRWRWLNVERRLEWLHQAGLVGPDGVVDLTRVAAETTARSGWWDPFDPDQFCASEVTIEQLAATLIRWHDDEVAVALSKGDGTVPPDFWRDWCAQPPAFRRLSAAQGQAFIHAGSDDWTTPPRQAWLLHAAATAALTVEVTVHAGLGHLMSPRSADGRRTYGPFTAKAIDAIVSDVIS